MAYLTTAAVVAGTAYSAYSANKAGKDAEKAAGNAADDIAALFQNLGIDPQVVSNNPNLGNSGLSGLSVIGQIMAGLPVDSALALGSPIGTSINEAGAAGFTQEELTKQQRNVTAVAQNYRAFRNYGYDIGQATRATRKKLGGERWSDFRLLAGRSGYTSPAALLEAQHTYDNTAAQIKTELEPLLPQIRAGRNDALMDAVRLASNLPDFSEQGLINLEEKAIAQQAPNWEEMRKAAYERAQTTNTNPAAELRKIDEEEARFRNFGGLQRATALAGTQSQLAGNQLASILGFLNSPTDALGRSGQLFGQGETQRGTIAANQVQQLNDIALRIALAQTEGLTQSRLLEGQGDLSRIQGELAANQAIGSGITGLGTSGLLNDILGALTGPSTAVTGSSGGITADGNRYWGGSDAPVGSWAPGAGSR